MVVRTRHLRVAVLSNFHVIITGCSEALVSEGPSGLERVRSLLTQSLSDGPLKAFHKTQLVGASASHLATLVDLHRIALTYVTNKKGGDQIMAAEAEET
jgi:hypothetical protein